MKYDELVKALRICAKAERDYECVGCAYTGYNCNDLLKLDAAAAIEALQAEVKRLKECNNELREAQTYIDHYGDKWLTSAKDVPTSAYNHGYMDGKNEAEQALEQKRGDMVEVVRCKDCDSWDTEHSSGRKSLGNYVCICQEWSDGEDARWVCTGEDEFCSRGERRAKMEVQDGTD